MQWARKEKKQITIDSYNANDFALEMPYEKTEDLSKLLKFKTEGEAFETEDEVFEAGDHSPANHRIRRLRIHYDS